MKPMPEQSLLSQLQTEWEKTKLPFLLADSAEVIEAHYKDRIISLQAQLNQFNLLEHAREITSCCQEIQLMRQKLANIQSGGK